MYFSEFSVLRIQEPFVLYRSYLWAAGAFCLLPVIFNRVNSRMAALVLSIIALAMFPVSMERLMTLSNSVLLWSDAEKLVKGRSDLPGIDRIYYNRGTEYLKVGEPDKAIADLKRAVDLNGHDVTEAYGNLGAAYVKKEDWSSAIAAFSKCIEISEKKPQVMCFQGRAIAYEKSGSYQNAQDDYRKSCAIGNRGCEKLLVK
jgi:tetratricopeptide (TPR) repeat protein